VTRTDIGLRSHSDELRELTRHVMVDFNQMKAFSSDPLILVEGDGIRVLDVEGNSYIDGLSGVFSVSLGHSNAEVIEAITAQLGRLAFASPIMATNNRALELAAELMALCAGRVDVVKQLGGGSESTEGAIKMARQYHRQTGNPTRYKNVSLYRAFHGATMGALSATGWARQRAPYEPLLPGFVHAQPPIPAYCRFCEGRGGCSLACARHIRDVIELEGPETVSSVILEPVMLTAGVRLPPPEYFSAVREICDETGVLLIFDEIVTGFGRLGHWFAADYIGVWPDIMCVGKGISGGYAPLSAILLTERVSSAFWGEPSDNRQFQAGHTFAGNPVSAAAGLAVIRYMREHDVLANAVAMGARLAERLEALPERSPYVGDVRGLGLLRAVEFVSDRSTGTPLPASLPFGTAVQQEARRRGLLVRASPQIVTFAPPLVVTAEEIDEIADIFEAAVLEVGAALVREGRLEVDVAFGL
jgi:adenosylmethionine-8-amino-7-oxononanoate aminotransferase